MYRLHREGRSSVWVTVLVVVALCVAAWYLFSAVWWGVCLGVGVVLVLFVMRFFRYPRRGPGCMEYAPDGVYSPCDGRVVEVGRARDHEVLEGEQLKVAIFMSVFNVHANYYPVSGCVSYRAYHKGRFLVAWLPKSSTDNEHSTVVVDRGDGHRFLMRQIAGAVARRIATYAREGMEVRAGEELGFIRFGSRVDVYLPLEAEAQVQVGDRVRGAESLIARLPLRES